MLRLSEMVEQMISYIYFSIYTIVYWLLVIDLLVVIRKQNANLLKLVLTAFFPSNKSPAVRCISFFFFVF